MKKLSLLALLCLISFPALAQVCPGGSTCNSLESYFNAAPGGAAVAPYSGSLRIPVTPGSTASTMQYIQANLLMDLSSSQTASNKTFTSAIFNGGVLSGVFSGAPTYTGIPTYSGLGLGTQVSCIGLNSSNQMVLSSGACGSGGGGGGTVASSAVGTVPVYTAATTVAGTAAITFSSGAFTLNQNSATSFPAFGGGTPHFLVVGPDSSPSKIAQLTFNSAAGSTTTMAAAGGTGASPTALAAGANLGTFGFAGYDTSNLTSSATMRAASAESGNFSPSAHGTNLILSTTPIGSTTLTPAVTIGSDQNITVAGQAGSGSRCIHVDAAGRQTPTGTDCGTTGGSGTVNTGTAPQAAYYASTGTAVSGNANVTFQSGFMQLNYNSASSFPAFGGSTPHLLIVGADTAPSKIGQLTFNNAAGSTTTMAAAGGTGASPTALGAGANLGTFGFAGYDTSNLTSSATMRAVSAESGNFSPSAHGTNLIFSTTPIGSTTLTVGMTLDSTQNMTVAGLAGGGVRCIHVDNTGKLSVASGDCATGGSGSVTSVTLSSPGGIFAVTGTNPITTTGTFGYTTTGNSGGVPYFSSSSQLASSATLTLYGTMIGGGAGAPPVTVPPNTAGFVLTSNGPSANPTFQAASGGSGTPVQSYGTFAGSVNAYTMASPTPAVSANTEGYRVCGTWPSSLAAPTGASTLAVGSAAALPTRVKSANNGIIAFTGKEVLPGTNGNPVCFQVMTSTWVLDSQAPGSATTNPTSPYSITQGDWASQGVFLQTSAGTTYNLPNLASTTLSSQAGVTIQTVGVTAQLCAAGTDVINNGLLTGASSAGGCITLPADGVYPINTSGTAGTTAWSVALGELQYFTLTWAEGLNLSTNARYISRFASPKVIYGIRCNVQAAAGTASLIHVFSTASGSAPNSGTELDSTGCDANTASNTEQNMGLASGGVGTTIPGYTIWATFSGSGTSGNGGLTITYR